MKEQSEVPMKEIVDKVLRSYVEQAKTLLNCITEEEGSLCSEMQKLIEIDSKLQQVKELLVRHQAFQNKLIRVCILTNVLFTICSDLFRPRYRSKFHIKIIESNT